MGTFGSMIPGFGNMLASTAAKNIGELAPVLASTAEPTGGGGIGGLFRNPLFIQLLAAAGTDISTGAGGKNVLAALQQNIGAKNYARVLSSILGGELPGAKMAVDGKGVKLNLPGAIGEAGVEAGPTAGGVTRNLLSPFGLAG